MFELNGLVSGERQVINQVVATVPALKPAVYEGPLEQHDVFQVKQMLEIDQVFDKPADLSHEAWYTALLSVVSFQPLPLSEAQREAIEPLQAFMKPASVDEFKSLQKPAGNQDLLSFGEIYDYVYWAILQKIPREYQKEMLPRTIDFALAVLPVGDLKYYKPSSKDYQDGFLIASNAEAFRILVREFMLYRGIEMGDDYDVMSYGVSTLKKVLDLLNDNRALTAAHISVLKLNVGLEGEVFQTTLADFKPQLQANIKQRIVTLECLILGVESNDKSILCKPEDFTALMNSVDYLDERLLFRHPQFLAIEGREIEAAGILWDEVKKFPEICKEGLENYWGYYRNRDRIIINIIIARSWLTPVKDAWEESLQYNVDHLDLRKVLTFKNVHVVENLINRNPLHRAALMNLLCSEHLALANPSTGHANRFFYLDFFLGYMSNNERVLTMSRITGEAAIADVPLEALPRLYLCYKKLGGEDNRQAFISGFISQFAYHSLKDIVKFCSGFYEVADRMGYLCQPAIRYKLTLKDIQDLVVASSPGEVFANKLIIMRLRLLLVDEASINMFEEHMRSHHTAYKRCDPEIRELLRTELVEAFTAAVEQGAQLQQSGELMTSLWRIQPRVPFDVRQRQFIDRINTVLHLTASSSAINRNQIRAPY